MKSNDTEALGVMDQSGNGFDSVAETQVLKIHS